VGKKRRVGEEEKRGRQASKKLAPCLILLTGLSSVAVAAMFSVCVILGTCDFLYSKKKEKRGRVGRVPTSLSLSLISPPSLPLPPI